MFQRFVLGLAVLMAPADGSDAGGGGGGGGAGGEGEPPKYVTIEQMNEVLNKALGSRDKRFESKLTETLGGFGKTIEEKLAALAPKAPESDGEQAGGGKGKVDPEFVKLKQTTDALTKRLEAETKRREDAETRGRSEKAANQLRGALSKHVRGEAVDVLLKAFRGDVQFDELGEPVFPLPDGSGTSTIDAAIEAWAKSDAAKAFIPAPSSGGSGTPRTGTGSFRGRDPATVDPKTWTPADRAEMLRRNQETIAERQRKNPMSFG